MKLVDRRNKWKWKSNFAGTTAKWKMCNKNYCQKRFRETKENAHDLAPKVFFPLKTMKYGKIMKLCGPPEVPLLVK